MSTIYNAATKTARMTAVRDQIDSGSGPGTLHIQTSGDVDLVVVPYDDPCGTVSGDVLTFSGLPNTAAAIATGTAAKAVVKNSTGTVIISGWTVGTSGTDVIIDSMSITTGQVISLNAPSTITHAA